MSSYPDPRIVVLNGGSSSGKSSIARVLQELASGIWLTFGVDTFIDSLPVAVAWVGVRCDPDVAAAREAGRPDRVQGMARHQALSVHSGMRYDFEVDTTRRSAEDCARDIACWLSARDLDGEGGRVDARSLQ